MRATLAIVLLFAPALVAPLAAAQSLPTTPCGPLEPSIVAPAGGVAPGGQGSVTVNVVNKGNNPTPAVIVVSVVAGTDHWSVVGETQKNASVAAGATAKLVFTLAADSSATQKATFNVAVSGTCAPPGNLACPGNACDAPSANTSGVIPLAAAGGVQVPSFLKDLNVPIEYIIVGALALAALLALPFLLRARSGGLRAACPEPLKLLRPGRGASFPLELRNTAAGEMTARFELSRVPEGWAAFLPVPDVQLAPKEARSLWLMVRAPPTARTGDKTDIEIRVFDAAQADAEGTKLRVRAEVDEHAPEPDRAPPA